MLSVVTLGQSLSAAVMQYITVQFFQSVTQQLIFKPTMTASASEIPHQTDVSSEALDPVTNSSWRHTPWPNHAKCYHLRLSCLPC